MIDRLKVFSYWPTLAFFSAVICFMKIVSYRMEEKCIQEGL